MKYFVFAAAVLAVLVLINIERELHTIAASLEACK